MIFQCFQKYRYLTSAFDRPEFRRMLADIELGKINMVIIKDVSRLGREHIDTNYYLGKYFPEKGIYVYDDGRVEVEWKALT